MTKGSSTATPLSSRLARLWRLPASDRRVLLGAPFRLVAVDLRLRTRGWAATRRAVEHGTRRRRRPPPDDPRQRAEQLAWLVAAAARLVPGATCLRRSLVLWAYLRREGISGDLQIGTERAADGRIRAHAWVEVDGRPLADPIAGTFVPFDRPLVPARGDDVTGAPGR